jgi:orotate phosphoribosyltransferase
MDRSELARRIKEVSYLTGDFLLRSGRRSTFYWDKYRFESDPTLLAAIGWELQKLLPSFFDCLAGLELGGVPLATVVSLQIGKPCLYVRKEAKTYGTTNLVEGGYRRGEVAVVVEDVVTSGGQVVTSVQQMRALGFVVDRAVCVIDREQGAREALAEIGCHLFSVYTLSEVQELATEAE